MKQYFTFRTGAMGFMAVALVAVGIFLTLPHSNKTDTLVSKGGQITLNGFKLDETVKNGRSITGVYKPSDKSNGTLYYIVTGADKNEVLGVGNIQTDSQNHFSRNLAISSKDLAGKPGTLEVYAQDKDGKRLDSAKASIKFE